MQDDRRVRCPNLKVGDNYDIGRNKTHGQCAQGFSSSHCQYEASYTFNRIPTIVTFIKNVPVHIF